MTVNEMIPAFEAVLFASGEPVETERFCQIFDTDYETVDADMKILSDRLLDRQSAIRLLKLENSYQLASAKEYAEYIRAALDLRRKAPLSQAALEVLAVIAYNQPVTKAYVEQVRGVDCSGVVSTLVEKDLLEERGRLELPGRPLLYGTTANFLRCFGLSSLVDLPDVPADETVEDPDGQLKMLSADVADLARRMNEEIEDIEESGE